MKKTLFIISIIVVIVAIGFSIYSQIHQNSTQSVPISVNNTVTTKVSPISQPTTTQNNYTLNLQQSESYSGTPKCPQNLIDELNWTNTQMDSLRIKLKNMPKNTTLPSDQANYWNNLISQWNDLATSHNVLINQLQNSNCNMP